MVKEQKDSAWGEPCTKYCIESDINTTNKYIISLPIIKSKGIA